VPRRRRSRQNRTPVRRALISPYARHHCQEAMQPQ
jgi:hypothetical protein